MKKKEALLRKPIGILLSALGLLLFHGATIPVQAQHTRYNDPRYLLGTPGVTAGLPGEQLVRAAVADLYTYNFNAAIPLLEKGVRLGNSDAMHYLAKCYNFGYGVPVDYARARQLSRMAYSIAERRALRFEREQQEERERSARAFSRAVENAKSRSASGGSSNQSTHTKPYKFHGPLVLTLWGIKGRTPLNSIWDRQ